MSDLIEEARHRYAEELHFTARLGSRAVIDAFATVPRERFFGPGHGAFSARWSSKNIRRPRMRSAPSLS
jgi:hypothetical protein